MTQERRVLNHLLDGHSITAIEALKNFGVMRLSAIIFNLRKANMCIEATWKRDRFEKNYVEYRMKPCFKRTRNPMNPHVCCYNGKCDEQWIY